MARARAQDAEVGWACPVCGGTTRTQRFRVSSDATEGGVNPEVFRPSADRFGTAVSDVVTCTRCGHATVAALPPPASVHEAYTDAADPVSIREEEGQVETARRAFLEIERWVAPGRVCDVGCWTGSFLVAARDRGWDGVGIEPSRWAAARASERGVDVRIRDLGDHGLPPRSFRLVSMCDVLEHLASPARALADVRELLEPGGAVYITVPDAGSRVARLLGRRWWSVLPMHLQYFTRASLARLLHDHGFEVRTLETHAKVFTARYYAERLAAFSPAAGRAALGAVVRMGWADRLIAPDFGDRMAAIAIAA